MIPRILFKHLTGSKANQIEQFPLDGTQDFTIGRGADARIAYDGQIDATVSRRHAMITITSGLPRLTFAITDLGSSNGTRVNGTPIQGAQELLLGDIVELGAGGPTFKLAVEPQSLGWHEQPASAQGAEPPNKHTLGRTPGSTANPFACLFAAVPALCQA